MRGLRQAGVVIAVLLALLAPTMRCTLADAQMTAQERACCQAMRSACGVANMPSSHGCCVKQAAANHPQAIQPKRKAMGAFSTIAGVMLLLPNCFAPNTRFDVARWQAFQPPDTSPPSQSPLRI